MNRKTIPFSIPFPIHLVTIPVPIPEELPKMANEPGDDSTIDVDDK